MFVGGILGTSPANATKAAGAPTARAARVANAYAQSNHAPGVRGGSGSGRPIGRSTAVRTATPPVATPAQKQLQRAAAARPSFTPKQRQGTSAPSFPTTAAQAAAHPAAARSTGGSRAPAPKAPNDFNYFRATDVTSATNGSRSGSTEPSVANDGNNVLYTGNWSAAMSNDSGNT